MEDLNIQNAVKILIVKAMVKYNGNHRKAAKALEISERTLYRMIHDYDIKSAIWDIKTSKYLTKKQRNEDNNVMV